MNWPLRLVMMTLGAVLAAGLHWAMTPTARGHRAAARPAAVAATEAAGAQTTCPEIPEEQRKLQRQVLLASLENARAKGRRDAREGEPLDWPDAPGDAAPDVLRTYLEEATEKLDDYTLLDLDCTEYPCVAVVSAPHHGAPNSTDNVRGQALTEGLPEGLESWYAQTSMAGPSDDRRDLFVVALATGEAPEGSERRLGGRVRTLAAEHHMQLEDTGV